jgi:hypothetical protein
MDLMNNTDGQIWFGFILGMLLMWGAWRAFVWATIKTATVLGHWSGRRKATRMMRNAARRRAMERHPAGREWQPTRPDAADYALRQWTDKANGS